MSSHFRKVLPPKRLDDTKDSSQLNGSFILVTCESDLFLVHDNDGEAHLLGPGAHHCCDGFSTGLFQTVPQVLCRKEPQVGMITKSSSPLLLHLLTC